MPRKILFAVLVVWLFLLGWAQADQPPVLSDAQWDPATTELQDFGSPPIPGFDDTKWYASALIWGICDEDNDLLPDGAIYILVSGTSDSFISEPYLDLAGFNDPPDVDLSATDCASPTLLGINILMAPESDPELAPPGNYCADLEASDTAGNFSNKIEHVCVSHDPYGTIDDDMVDDDVVDDDATDDDTNDDDDNSGGNDDDSDDGWIEADDDDDDDDDDDNGCG